MKAKNRLFLCIMALMVMIATSCNEKPTPDGPGAAGSAPEAITLTIVDTNPLVTKTYLASDGTLRFKKGDCAVAFIGSTAPLKYDLSSTAGRTAGTFSLDKETATKGEKTSAAIVCLPYDKSISVTADGILKLNLPTTQKHIDGSLDEKGLICVGEATNDTFNDYKLQSIYGIYKLTLCGSEDVKNITLGVGSAKAVAGDARISFKDGNPVVDIKGNVTREIKLECNTTLSTEGVNFHFMLPAGKYSQGFSIKIECDGSSMEYTTEAATIVRGQITDGGEIKYAASSINSIAGTAINPQSTVGGIIRNSATGEGIPGVPVTDGYKYTVTDANGVYQMKADSRARKIYYSTPSDYEIALNSKSHTPAFYSTGILDGSVFSRIDFELTPLATPEDKFTLVMVGDPQCKTTSNANRYKNETIPDIKKTISAGVKDGIYFNTYAMTLGDITFDSNDMYSTMVGSMSNVMLDNRWYVPFFQSLGNHDHNALTNSDYEATALWFENFGPTDYSFNRGKVHIIAMDDIICDSPTANSSPNGKTWSYHGGFTSEQVEWLRQDLSYVENKADKMVLICCHIPFRESTSNNYDKVIKMLAEFKEVHVMIGHTHYTQNYVYNTKAAGGTPIYEHIHGSACGSWWTCNNDTAGVPQGYTIYEVEGNSIVNWKLKGTNYSSDLQMRVYDGNQTYGTGASGEKYIFNWYNTANKGGTASITCKGNTSLKNAFVATVFNDDPTYWKVELYQGGKKVGDFKRLGEGVCANIAACAYYFNIKNKNTTSYNKTNGTHIWYYVPASDDPTSEKNWEVVATQTIPTSGKVNVFRCSTLSTDYKTIF